MADETPDGRVGLLNYAGRGSGGNRRKTVSWVAAHLLTGLGVLLAVVGWNVGHPTPHPFRSEDFGQLAPIIIGLPLCAIQLTLMTVSIACILLPRSPAKPWGWRAALAVVDVALVVVPAFAILRVLHA